mmetsp:Transcript_94/g.216  ORF Transcript_94/g.216 Transcript_94/m.216 type:complete len:270 (+) Transcript_94:515-1324(+)
MPMRAGREQLPPNPDPYVARRLGRRGRGCGGAGASCAAVVVVIVVGVRHHSPGNHLARDEHPELKGRLLRLRRDAGLHRGGLPAGGAGGQADVDVVDVEGGVGVVAVLVHALRLAPPLAACAPPLAAAALGRGRGLGERLGGGSDQRWGRGGQPRVAGEGAGLLVLLHGLLALPGAHVDYRSDEGVPVGEAVADAHVHVHVVDVERLVAVVVVALAPRDRDGLTHGVAVDLLVEGVDVREGDAVVGVRGASGGVAGGVHRWLRRSRVEH